MAEQSEYNGDLIRRKSIIDNLNEAYSRIIQLDNPDIDRKVLLDYMHSIVDICKFDNTQIDDVNKELIV